MDLYDVVVDTWQADVMDTSSREFMLRGRNLEMT